MKHLARFLTLLALALCFAGCGDSVLPVQPGSDTASLPTVNTSTTPLPAPGGVISGYPSIQDCKFPGPIHPRKVLVTSTDFSTGALGWIDPQSKQVHPDLVLAHTDTAITHSRDHAFLINRMGSDSIKMLRQDDALTVLGEFSVQGEGSTSANPHDLFVDDRGYLHLSFLGRDHLKVYDTSYPQAPKLVRKVDLSAFSDADGLPEASAIIPCGEVYFVEVQRLDRKAKWAPVDSTYLVPVHVPTGALYDFDGSNDGIPDGIPIQGAGVAGWKQDPRPGAPHRILVLNRGVQSIDLRTREVQSIIPESRIEALGVQRWDVRSFELSADAKFLWLLMIDNFPGHSLYRASLDAQGQDLQRVFEGIESVTGSMRRVGNELWVADTREGLSGVRILQIRGSHLSERPESPLPVGLPPYGLHLLP